MKKRGQVTIFVILGVMLLAGVILLFYLQNTSYEGELISEVQKEDAFSSVEFYVSSCLWKASKDALWEVGRKGGYSSQVFSQFDDQNLTIGQFNAPIYADASSTYSVPNESMEYNISQEIASRFINCLDFSIFTLRNYSITVVDSSLFINTSITPKQVVVDAFMDVRARFQDQARAFDRFNVNLPLELYQTRQKANTFIEEIQRMGSAGTIDISTLCAGLDLGSQMNVYVRPGGGASQNIVRFIDYSPRYNQIGYSYEFDIAIVDYQLDGACSG